MSKCKQNGTNHVRIPISYSNLFNRIRTNEIHYCLFLNPYIEFMLRIQKFCLHYDMGQFSANFVQLRFLSSFLTKNGLYLKQGSKCFDLKFKRRYVKLLHIVRHLFDKIQILFNSEVFLFFCLNFVQDGFIK